MGGLNMEMVRQRTIITVRGEQRENGVGGERDYRFMEGRYGILPHHNTPAPKSATEACGSQPWRMMSCG